MCRLSVARNLSKFYKDRHCALGGGTWAIGDKSLSEKQRVGGEVL